VTDSAQPSNRAKQEWEAEVEWAVSASDEEVGPACMEVRVPKTVDMISPFREGYEQGYRHALSDVRKVLGDRLRDD
jgi:hypothetical protein